MRFDRSTDQTLLIWNDAVTNLLGRQTRLRFLVAGEPEPRQIRPLEEAAVPRSAALAEPQVFVPNKKSWQTLTTPLEISRTGSVLRISPEDAKLLA